MKDDLISRQAAIENSFEVYTKEYGWCEVVGVDAINSLLSAQPGWIPCSERNPEKNGFYLVTTKAFGWNCKEYTDVDTSYYGDGIWYKKRVLAWQPLPTPYREGGQDE